MTFGSGIRVESLSGGAPCANAKPGERIRAKQNANLLFILSSFE
jgi:hypothetical protein